MEVPTPHPPAGLSLKQNFIRTMAFKTAPPTTRSVMLRATKRRVQRNEAKASGTDMFPKPTPPKLPAPPHRPEQPQRQCQHRFKTVFHLPDQTQFKLNIAQNQANLMDGGSLLANHRFREDKLQGEQVDFRTHFHLPNNQQIRLNVARDLGEMMRGAPREQAVIEPVVHEPFLINFPKLRNEQNMGDKQPYFKCSTREPYNHDLHATRRLRKLFPKAAQCSDMAHGQNLEPLRLTFAPLKPTDRLYTLDGVYHQDPRY